MNPQLGQKRDDLTPDLGKAQVVQAPGRGAGGDQSSVRVLPALHNTAATGPVIREAQRASCTMDAGTHCQADQRRSLGQAGRGRPDRRGAAFASL